MMNKHRRHILDIMSEVNELLDEIHYIVLGGCGLCGCIEDQELCKKPECVDALSSRTEEEKRLLTMIDDVDISI